LLVSRTKTPLLKKKGCTLIEIYLWPGQSHSQCNSQSQKQKAVYNNELAADQAIFGQQRTIENSNCIAIVVVTVLAVVVDSGFFSITKHRAMGWVQNGAGIRQLVVVKLLAI